MVSELESELESALCSVLRFRFPSPWLMADGCRVGLGRVGNG